MLAGHISGRGPRNLWSLSMKDRLIFLAEVAVAVAVLAAFQKHVYAIPVVGKYLPGGS